VWLSLGIVAAAVIFLLAGDIRRYAPATSRKSPRPVDEEVPTSGDTSVPETSIPEKRSPVPVLDEIRDRLDECKTLNPEGLRQSPGFVAAETLAVLPKYKDRCDRVRQAYTALIEIRDRMVKRQGGKYVAYYYDEAGKDATPATKLQKIAEILEEAPLGSEDCEVLKEAFGFEFENADSVVSRWCDTLGKLDKTAVRIPLRHRKRGG